MKSLFVSGVLLLAMGTATLWSQAEKQWDPNLMELAPALREAGFDRNDPESLIRAARHENVLVRQGAAYGLRFFRSAQVTSELLHLVDDSVGSISIMACQSLAELQDLSWVAQARGRLSSFENGHEQLGMSNVLAKAGDFSGWHLVKQNLTKEYYASSALYTAMNFIGMKDSQGKDIDIAQELELLAPQIEPKAKAQVAAVVRSIREEQARRRASGVAQ